MVTVIFYNDLEKIYIAKLVSAEVNINQKILNFLRITREEKEKRGTSREFFTRIAKIKY